MAGRHAPAGTLTALAATATNRDGSDMSDMLEHRGYLGSVLYSDEDETFHGRLEYIRDLVTYEGSDAASLTNAFQAEPPSQCPSR